MFIFGGWNYSKYLSDSTNPELGAIFFFFLGGGEEGRVCIPNLLFETKISFPLYQN